MVSQSGHILIMAGGTGGHVYPALAVAEHLRSQGVRVSWMGTRKGLEARLVPDAGFPIEYIAIHGLRGKGLLSWLFAPLKLTVALWQALMVCLKLKPNVVLGMGGFVTGPGGMASWLLRRPLLIHEQNAIPGFTNRLLSRLAIQVMEAFPGSFPNKAHAIHTGNPIREDICTLEEPQQRMANHQGPLHLLVIGGSLGAHALNECIPAVLGLVAEEMRPEVWHQTGKNKLDYTRQQYAGANVEAKVVPYIDDMAEAYTWADLVICRAGALTVFELAAVGLASILVPYPHAVDDHQTYNAHYLADVEAARILLQTSLTANSLQGLLTELIRSGREQLLVMARKARQVAMPHATTDVANLCLKVMHA